MPAKAHSAELPLAAILVLRDRGDSDPLHVLVTAIDELIAAGVWTVADERRGWRRRHVPMLAPAPHEPLTLDEPLASVDGVLRCVAVDRHGASFSVEGTARWIALHRRHAGSEAVRGTIAALTEIGLLERTSKREVTVVGRALLSATPLPAPARLTADDPRVRRDAIRTLTPVGAAFVTAWDATLGRSRDGWSGDGGAGDLFPEFSG